MIKMYEGWRAENYHKKRTLQAQGPFSFLLCFGGQKNKEG